MFVIDFFRKLLSSLTRCLRLSSDKLARTHGIILYM